MKLNSICLVVFLIMNLTVLGQVKNKIEVLYTEIEGLDHDPNGFIRRDNSDIIKVDGLYYVWYSKMRQFIPDLPIVSTIWYATSPDGYTWTEKGECISTGESGTWDDLYVFTPGILEAEGKYYLFYTAQSKNDSENGGIGRKTAIGMTVANSPDGPWAKVESPVLVTSEDHSKFDSHRIDDSCLIMRGGKYWLYYKGRQWGKPPTETKMGVAIAYKPEDPFVKHESNPLVEGGHEVLVWPQGNGVGALVGMKLGEHKEVPFYLMYAEDGIHFKRTGQIDNQNAPWAPGAFRLESFNYSGKGKVIEWGLHIGGKRPELFLERFDFVKKLELQTKSD